MTELPEANWYPDPMGRHEYRLWDGSQWTDRVASNGVESVDPSEVPPEIVRGATSPRVEKQVAKAGVTGGTGGFGRTSLFDQPVLVVHQKVKLVEINSEYAIFDDDGSQIGAVRQVGQGTARKLLRAFTRIEQFLTHNLQVVDSAGVIQLQLTRPAKILKSRVIVRDGGGVSVGEVVQKNVFGKINFGFVVDGHEVGGIYAENWRAWNFSLKDHNGNEVARITKTFEGILKTLFTVADNYVLQVHRPLDEPLRFMVVASALAIDTALKQDSRGIEA